MRSRSAAACSPISSAVVPTRRGAPHRLGAGPGRLLQRPRRRCGNGGPDGAHRRHRWLPTRRTGRQPRASLHAGLLEMVAQGGGRARPRARRRGAGQVTLPSSAGRSASPQLVANCVWLLLVHPTSASGSPPTRACSRGRSRGAALPAARDARAADSRSSASSAAGRSSIPANRPARPGGGQSRPVLFPAPDRFDIAGVTAAPDALTCA